MPFSLQSWLLKNCLAERSTDYVNARRPGGMPRVCVAACGLVRRLVVRPGPVATAQVPRPDLTCRIAETALYFARNSPATISNIEFRSLELQRFLTLLKLCSIELRATFLGAWPHRPHNFACNS